MATTLTAGLITAIALLGVVTAAPVDKPASGTTQGASKTEKSQSDAMYSRAQALAVMVRSRAKDPSSFVAVEAGYTEAGTILLVYRARNSFNAVVTSRAILTPAGQIVAGDDRQFNAAWNKYLAGKTLHSLPRP